MNMKHLPDSFEGPVATIDQTTVIDDEKNNCGFVLAVDDKEYDFSGVSLLGPVFRSEPGKHRLLLRGHVVYFSELRNLSSPPHAEGWVEVNLISGKRYRVMTETDESGSRVWLSDAETGAAVSPIISPTASS
jgi:hypothetical protein